MRSGLVLLICLACSCTPERAPWRGNSPANLPPEDYAGVIWVDKTGCAFVRSARDGWVPQLDEKRAQFCDAQNAPVNAPEVTETAPEAPVQGTVIDPETGTRTTYLPPQQIAPQTVTVGPFASAGAARQAAQILRDLGYPLAPGTEARQVVLGPFRVASALFDARTMVKRLGYKMVPRP